MSLVFNSSDAMVSPSLSSTYVGGDDVAQEGLVGVLNFPGYLKRGSDEGAKSEIHTDEAAAASDSSSISGASDGENDDSDEVGEEVESMINGSSFNSMGSLEDSLPIKRGLSNHFSGKSKSFANLSQVKSVKEIEKQENPLNKRRRVMIAYKWSKKSSFYVWKNPTSMPLLALNENEEEEEQDTQNEQEAAEEGTTCSKKEEENELQEIRNKQLQGSKSCFSLTDLYK